MTARWAVRAATETEPSRPRTGVGETEPLMGTPPDPSPFRRKGTQCAQKSNILLSVLFYNYVFSSSFGIENFKFVWYNRTYGRGFRPIPAYGSLFNFLWVCLACGLLFKGYCNFDACHGFVIFNRLCNLLQGFFYFFHNYTIFPAFPQYCFRKEIAF